MAFDKDDSRPLVDPERRTTKVNVAMVIALIAFFVVAGLVVWRLWARGG
jgi:hypothetical protein